VRRNQLLDSPPVTIYNNPIDGVAELADAADLKFQAKMSNSYFTFEKVPLCYMPKTRFVREVPLCH